MKNMLPRIGVPPFSSRDAQGSVPPGTNFPEVHARYEGTEGCTKHQPQCQLKHLFPLAFPSRFGGSPEYSLYSRRARFRRP